MHPYRTHDCGALCASDSGSTVRLSGWIDRKRDHSNVLFLDLRDHKGVTQCVIDRDNPFHEQADALRLESVVTVTGTVIERTKDLKNPKLPTGEIELQVQDFVIQSSADQIPIRVNSEEDAGEEHRLRYRYLDLRRQKMQRNIRLRADVIASMRQRMIDQGFQEFQTPILTSSSPEGARDFLVPSRLHPGHFYALPQAPQQFKQLLMMAGFDRYFQIAPCFRDEDSRADRSPGEFYQLDFEMAFVTQQDVFDAIEPVLHGLFEAFSENPNTGVKRVVTPMPFPQIPFEEAMLKYGSDKPDLRNPLLISDVTEIFKHEAVTFNAFKNVIAKGGIVRAIPGTGAASKPRAFFDKLNDWARGEGAPGLGYIIFDKGEGRGPIAKFVPAEQQQQLRDICGLQDGDAVFFVCDQPLKAAEFAGAVRKKLGEDLDLLEKDVFKFCWIVDFPMYEFDEKLQKIEFSHNPFSMPQGGLEALETKDPLEIKAYQYDIVCNGIELSSGAIRNHLPDVMYKAFDIAGYPAEEVENRFGGMLSAMKFGAPPHGGCAPGVDRIVMMLADEPNIREVVAFPMNQQAMDLMMQAPSDVTADRLRELHIRVALPPKIVDGQKQD